jgi:hypothetical protein
MVEINHANASDNPTDHSPLIEMLREDIPAVSMVSKESILYGGAVMRFIKNALNLSGHTVYKLPGQSNLEALIDELYSGTSDQHSIAANLYHARMAELTGPTIATIGTPVGNNYSEQQCPVSSTAPPSSSQRHNYRDNSNCPSSPTPPPSTSRQVSFRDGSSGSQGVRAQAIQPIAPVIGSTAILGPPVSQYNSRQTDHMTAILASIHNCQPNTESGKKAFNSLRSAIVKIRKDNTSSEPTDYSGLIGILRDNIAAASSTERPSFTTVR